ncbi:MAG: acyl-CoA dehydrogenase family protein [Pseudomonadales bacterium]|nr:acyl-CoA dehydrogenase family protein [Pseudomonadales bacterium]
MDFSYSDKTEQLRAQLGNFMQDHIVPRIGAWRDEVNSGKYPVSFMDDLKNLAKSEGLWNLFLPGLREDEPGTQLSNLEYAPLAEIMGRVPWSSEVFNCNAPDTGNMEVLHMFASEQQRKDWLEPLLNGEIRSAFAMTEPDVASSDATNIQTSIVRQGDDYLINGRKWFITNAHHPNCRVFILMGKTDPDADSHRQQSMVLVPMDTPGVELVRNISTINHHSPEGHSEVLFRNVKVPASNLIGQEGDGFMIAQARLGPGRIHHCMRSIGMAEVCLDLMVARAQERKTFGKYLYQHGAIGEWIARSRIEIEQARLLVLKTAALIDQVGARGARKEISMIKVIAPTLLTTVADRAMQVFGAMGVSPDTPLADFYTGGRVLRFADGPDEVHLQTIARLELKDSGDRRMDIARYLTPAPGGS